MASRGPGRVVSSPAVAHLPRSPGSTRLMRAGPFLVQQALLWTGKSLHPPGTPVPARSGAPGPHKGPSWFCAAGLTLSLTEEVSPTSFPSPENSSEVCGLPRPRRGSAPPPPAPPPPPPPPPSPRASPNRRAPCASSGGLTGGDGVGRGKPHRTGQNQNSRRHPDPSPAQCRAPQAGAVVTVTGRQVWKGSEPPERL